MKISKKKLTLKEALRRRAQRRALKEAAADFQSKKSRHFVLKEELGKKSTIKEFFGEAEDDEVIEIDDAPVDGDDTVDIEVSDDEDAPAEEDPNQEIKDAIRILAANAGMTADDFEEIAVEEPAEESVANEETLMSAEEFFNQTGDETNEPTDPTDESKKCDLCEDDEEIVPDDSEEPVGDETTDLSVDTEVADLSGATDLSGTTDLSGDVATDISGTVDNPATPEEEETAETAKKLADMTPEDWFQLLNQI